MICFRRKKCQIKGQWSIARGKKSLDKQPIIDGEKSSASPSKNNSYHSFLKIQKISPAIASSHCLCYLADTKRAVAQRRPGPERRAAAYRRTREREQIILIVWPSEIGGRQHDNAAPPCVLGIKSQALTLLFL